MEEKKEMEKDTLGKPKVKMEKDTLGKPKVKMEKDTLGKPKVKMEKDTLGKPKVKTSESMEGKSVVSTLSLRGRKFEGNVIRKFDNRVTIEFQKTKLIRKYERYIKRNTKIHAKLPENLKNEINVGDYIQIQECRPLSKILHHVVVKKIRGGNEK